MLSPSPTASLCEREEKERRKKPGAAHCKDVKKRTLYLSKAGAKIGKGRTTPKHKGNFFTQNEKLFRKGLGNRAMKGRGKKAKGKGDTLLYYKGGLYHKGGGKRTRGNRDGGGPRKKGRERKKEGGKAQEHKKTGERHKLLVKRTYRPTGPSVQDTFIAYVDNSLKGFPDAIQRVSLIP